MQVRRCPRCDQELTARQKFGGSGLMLLWQCSCGWAGARTLAAGEDVTEVRSKSGTTVRVHIELDGDSEERKIGS